MTEAMREASLMAAMLRVANGDPALKKALAAMSRRVTALNGDVSKIDDRELAGLRTTLDEACGTK